MRKGAEHIKDHKLRYSQFWDRISVDAFEEAIDFEPLHHHRGNDIGYCPDPWNLHTHGDTTGKFAIHREKRVYNCWVCGGGNLLSLAMAVKDMDVGEATEWLYQFASDEQYHDDDFIRKVQNTFEQEKPKEKTMPWFNAKVLDKWVTYHPFFEERGISEAVAERYQLGLNETAICKGPKGTYLGPALIIPHWWKSKLVGWQYRWIGEDRPKWVRKYTNTGDFPRRTTLFNYHMCEAVKLPPIVVESPVTTLYLESMTLPSIATFGSEPTPEQLVHLRRFPQGVVLAPDNDGAGEKWTNTLTEYLGRFTIVTVLDPVTTKPGADLGDLTDPEDLAEHLQEYANHVHKVSED